VPRDGQTDAHIARHFDVAESMASMCFSSDLRLDVDGMFRAKSIADKIREAGTGGKPSVVLDEQEMRHVRDAYQLLKGLPEHFVEFLRRIRDAERVELDVKGAS
jgi:hypothetical protein